MINRQQSFYFSLKHF